ncbi:MAG TPA: carboxymuconolactone decarboxylase family protein [Amycolatopsis sp.]|uniref:carboxymuconolactone decarboxylase family protein n=1 Tax=unclassified Amycolatopsis TaxID=2618356 RepID=UPI001F0F9ED0|nr:MULTISPECIES: carboxymuconolactone decarboxylase family protein [unclassified Amycolatopsis]HWD05806.1 carboxymuconolactone decarboxylase family protein [Amycolatopsis sp.]
MSSELGRKMMDEVYGAGFSETLPAETTPMLEKTVDHLFGEIWSRPGLSVRDRRLLVLGATAALGRADLVQIQVEGALANDELTAEQLREAVLHLQYYVGWGNGTQVNNGVEAALRAREAKEKK